MKYEDIHYSWDVNEEKKTEKTKLPKWIIGAFGGLLAVIMILIAILILRTNKPEQQENKVICFNEDCFTVVFEGYNTMGRAYVSPNYTEINKVVSKAVKDLEDSEEIQERIANNTTLYLDMDEELSNERYINVCINVKEEVLKEYELEVSNIEYAVKVSGLKLVNVINAFESLTVAKKYVNNNWEVEMIYPGGSYDWEGIKKDDFICTVNSDGTATISLKDAAINELKSRGVVADSIEQNYVIENLNETVLTDFEDVTDEIREEIIRRSEYDCDIPYEKYMCFETKYYGGWLNVYEDAEIVNELVLIFEVGLYDEYGNKVTTPIYRKVITENVTIHSDGTVRWHSINYVDTSTTCINGNEYVVGTKDYNEYVAQNQYIDDYKYTYFDPKGQIYGE